jgi:hypothetical protein
MVTYKDLKSALVIAISPFYKDSSLINRVLESEDIKNLILTVPQKIELLNGASATGDSAIFSAICNLKITEEITKDEKVKFLEWAISAKEPSIVADICKLESTEKINKKQQKELIYLAKKSNNIDIINCINNYNFLNPKSKEEEAPKVTIPEPLNLKGFTDLSLGDKEPLMVDNKNKKSWTEKLNNFLKPKSGKYQKEEKRRLVSSEENLKI